MPFRSLSYCTCFEKTCCFPSPAEPCVICFWYNWFFEILRHKTWYRSLIWSDHKTNKYQIINIYLCPHGYQTCMLPHERRTKSAHLNPINNRICMSAFSISSSFQIRYNQTSQLVYLRMRAVQCQKRMITAPNEAATRFSNDACTLLRSAAVNSPNRRQSHRFQYR